MNKITRILNITWVKNKIELFVKLIVGPSLREKCLYSEFFWTLFSRIRTEYGEMRLISPFPV